MLTDRAAFEAAILANRRDHTTRLVFADWLDECGDEESAARAALIRGEPQGPRYWPEWFGVQQSAIYFDEPTDGLVHWMSVDGPVSGVLDHGFASTLRMETGAFLCGWCLGVGRHDVIHDREPTGEVMGCRVCNKVGVRAAIVEIVKRQPVTRIEFTNREPWCFRARGRVSFGWYDAGRTQTWQDVHPESEVPRPLFARLLGHFGHDLASNLAIANYRKRWRTEGEAFDALSDAAMSMALVEVSKP